MHRKKKSSVYLERRKKTSYHFRSAIGTAVQSFVLHALFLLSAYVMAQRVFPMEGLSERHWLWLGGTLAALVVLFEVLLPAVALRLPYRWEGALLRISASGAILYPAVREGCRFYLEHQLDLEDGLLALADNYVRTYNDYYGRSVQLPSGNEEYRTLAVFFCMMIVLIAQFLLVQITGLRACMMAAALGVLVAEMWIGLTQDVGGLLLFSLSCVMLAAGRIGTLRTKSAAVALWLLLFGIVTATGNGLAERLILKAPEYKEYQKKLETAVKNLSTANLWGVRETVTNDRPEFSDKEILTISAEEKPVSNLYLKSFVGTSYENGSWKEDTRTFSYECRSEGIDAENVNELLWNTTVRAVEGNAWGFLETDYTIRYVYNPQSYALLPYFTDLDGLGEVFCVGDQRLKVKRGTKELTVHGTAWNDYGRALAAMRYLYNADSVSDESWDWYGSYVKEQYLGTSDAVELAESLTNELSASYIDMFTAANRNTWRVYMAENVAEYLDQNYTYSWNLDDITDGTDPVQYFLETGKKGYCMHFAAAGTLMLRKLGIPARYAAGYVVKADAFTLDENGSYTAKVLDRNAHAWTEIYLDNYGWVPIEMTPGFSEEDAGLPTDKAAAEARELAENGTKNDTQQSQNKEESESGSSREPDSEENEEDQVSLRTEAPEETENQNEAETVPEPDKTADGKKTAQSIEGETGGARSAGDESGSGGNAVGRWILFLAAVVLGLAAIFAGGVRFIKKRIQDYHAYVDFEIRRKHYRGAVTCVNRRIYRKLRQSMRMRKRPVTDHEYEQLLYRTFSQISPETWGRYMEIVKKAAFSGEGPEEEEAVFCREIYRTLLMKSVTEHLQT
jgi:hypothetical protein